MGKTDLASGVGRSLLAGDPPTLQCYIYGGKFGATDEAYTIA